MDPIAPISTLSSGPVPSGRVVSYGGTYDAVQAGASRNEFSFAAQLAAIEAAAAQKREAAQAQRQEAAQAQKQEAAATPQAMSLPGVRESFAYDHDDRLPPNPIDPNYAGPQLFGKDGIGLGTLLDVVNPLQHIPVVSTIYRRLTGDDISTGARLAGGFLFGGPIGLATSAANALIEIASGRDLGDHALAALGLENELKGATPEGPMLAEAAPPQPAAQNLPPAAGMAAAPAGAATSGATLAQVFAEPKPEEPAGFMPLDRSTFMPLARETAPLALPQPTPSADARNGAIEGQQWFPLNSAGNPGLKRPVGVQQVARPNGSGGALADGRGWPGGAPPGLSNDASQQLLAERALFAYQRSLDMAGASGPGLGAIGFGGGPMGVPAGSMSRSIGRADQRN